MKNSIPFTSNIHTSRSCRLAEPGVYDRKVPGFSQDAVWRISYGFMTADEDGRGWGMMG